MRGRPVGDRKYRSLSTYHPDDEPILGDERERYAAAKAGSLSLRLALERYYAGRAAA